MKLISTTSLTLSGDWQDIIAITPDDTTGNVFVSGWVDLTLMGGLDKVEIQMLYNGKPHGNDIFYGLQSSIMYIEPRLVGIGDTYKIRARQLSGSYTTIQFKFFAANK